MMTLRTAVAALLGAATLSGCVVIDEGGAPRAQGSAGLEAELVELRARDAIRELIHAYGRTLDARDFDGFAELWAENAEYVGGPGGQAVVGPDAIAGFLEGIFAANPSGLEGPTAHLFANEHIEVDGRRGSGTSLGAFLAQDGDGAARIVILATYEDDYVVEDGRWKFARRVVRGVVPASGR
jgi:ketosteroid isomerase-like protein